MLDGGHSEYEGLEGAEVESCPSLVALQEREQSSVGGVEAGRVGGEEDWHLVNGAAVRGQGEQEADEASLEVRAWSRHDGEVAGVLADHLSQEGGLGQLLSIHQELGNVCQEVH